VTSDRDSCSQTRVGVGVVVHSADGLVLVARRRGEPGQQLAVPGGKLDPGETVEECAVRELAEETGLVLDVADVRTFDCVLLAGDLTSWIVAGVEAHLGVRAAEAEPRELEPDKVGCFTWIDPADAPSDLYPATAALLARLAPT
jgi:8-oxo-dGTP diphosphatase